MRVVKMWFYLVALLVVSSCASQKEITYLQGPIDSETQELSSKYDVRFQPDDLIAIMVNSRDIELAQMFNLPMISYQRDAQVIGQNRALGYLVDKEGYIDFPQVGLVMVEGLTPVELSKKIKNLLIDGGYINDPVVTVQFLNFQISVIGEVTRPGSFDIGSEKVTVLDALGLAGDLTIYGKRENIKVIRTVDGKRTIAEVDLRSADILNSPYYYLRQNDVVYVEPNKARAGQREINANRTISTYTSILNVILTLVAILL